MKTTTTLAFLAALAAMSFAANPSHGGDAEGEDPTRQRDAVATEQRFIRFAEKLPYFDWREVVYGRGLYSDPRTAGHVRPYSAFLQLVQTVDTRLLTRLLKHPSPGVRTLALAALFTKHEHKAVLLGAAGLFEDQSKTYPSVFWNINARGFARDKLPAAHTTQQTVGMVATKLYGCYREHASRYRVPIPFDEYWAARRDRDVCAGWLAMEYGLAYGGSTAIGPYEEERGKRLREKLARLPDADRGLTIAWIATSRSMVGSRFMSEKELLDTYRKLGHQAIVRILKGNPSTTDPDLQLKYGTPHRYKLMMKFILKHADVLLKPSDAELLRRLHGLSQRPPSSGRYLAGYAPPRLAEWMVVAARLSPAPGNARLKAAIRDFESRYSSDNGKQARLVASLWHQAGQKELGYILDWFYQPKDISTGYPDTRSAFLKAIQTDPNAENNIMLVRKIALDRRLNQLQAKSIRTLIEVANNLSGRAIVASDEMRQLSHPLGVSHYFLYKRLIQRPETNQTEHETAAFRRDLSANLEANKRVEDTIATWREKLMEWAGSVE